MDMTATDDEPLHVVKAHDGEILTLSFCYDGTMLASGGGDNFPKLWRVSTDGKFLEEYHILTGHSRGVHSIAFSPDGKSVVTGSTDFHFGVWDILTNQLLILNKDHTGPVCKVAFSPNGKELATASHDFTVRLWDTTRTRPFRFPGHVLKGQWKRDFFTEGPPIAYEGHFISMSISPDGKVLAAGSNVHTIYLWDVATGKPLHVLEGHAGSIRDLAFSPDGTLLATAGWFDNTARIWDVATGRTLHLLEPHPGEISFGPHSTHQELSSVAFSPDGKVLATGSWDHTARIWDVATGGMLHVLEGHEHFIHQVAFSPNGGWLATAAKDSTVRLWDTRTWELKRVLRGHVWGDLVMAFSPDGSLLATGARDGTLRIWQMN